MQQLDTEVTIVKSTEAVNIKQAVIATWLLVEVDKQATE